MNDIQKAQSERILSCYSETSKSLILKAQENDIEKGGSAMIGETRSWSGKNYKKQANGKWLEISGDNKTKKEHEEAAKQHQDYYQSHDSDKPSTQASMNQHFRHKEIAAGLSDKEHSDKEVGAVALDQELTLKDVKRWTGYTKEDLDDIDYDREMSLKDHVTGFAEMLGDDDSRALRRLYKKMLKTHPKLAEEIREENKSSFSDEYDD